MWYLNGLVVFSYFFQFTSEFGNKEFMIWTTVSSWSCFCCLYRASPSSVAKSIINLILVLTIWWCPCVESSLVLLEEGFCYDPRLGKIWLAFALLHSVMNSFSISTLLSHTRKIAVEISQSNTSDYEDMMAPKSNTMSTTRTDASYYSLTMCYLP